MKNYEGERKKQERKKGKINTRLGEDIVYISFFPPPSLPDTNICSAIFLLNLQERGKKDGQKEKHICEREG